MTYFDILDLKNTFEVINGGLLHLHNFALAFYETIQLILQPIDLTIHGLDLTCQAFLLLGGERDALMQTPYSFNPWERFHATLGMTKPFVLDLSLKGSSRILENPSTSFDR
jgi:hypothetical protein